MNRGIVRRFNTAGRSPLTRRAVPAGKRLITRKSVPVVKRGMPVPQRNVVVHKQSNGIKFSNAEVASKFNPAMLDLGNLNAPCEEKGAVTAVFDITDFTKFCNQVDAYLEIPRFLNYFLRWFFKCIVNGLTEENDGFKTTFWADLPILVKFLGDGLLIVWNTQRMTPDKLCRLVATLFNICRAYSRDFYPQINKVINKPPAMLRCGVARGRVFSLGNGRDYIGHCINNASRLSHMDGMTFAFPNRGFQIREYLPDNYVRIFVPKYVDIKGVGDNEMVWVIREEYDKLPEEKKKLYRPADDDAEMIELE